MKIKAVIWQEDGVWCGSVPALPGLGERVTSERNAQRSDRGLARGWSQHSEYTIS
ncbi:hypothetical protein V0288_00625 [Pannus brasiliensis CCIBt3594]|uniref:Type II toxin-antitoxin system HicB family antitoxin n=1 Tax=Pannus brasiliensis CCIBt3594 TaxID=1427578 RepID=A0AAW9QKG4_9CHRO